ncbi:hypothetical protein DMB42_11405 [Nonomuraea sp. WAC 01424]|uniref:hypothetical protein n=1 Tax=Nonomuraea sp. WAC 01424 TaxID=2203200 RepID=UPI000F7754A7|nr:hypothetical protein [Nonomuraea sp. WAC 01424]RSN12777.1 hypothetical protein DMB42_11405 [Nonomuraea sp. WAC 01424]
MFSFLDKVANAGARSTMPAEILDRAKAQGQTTNTRNQLAQIANGFGVSRDAKRAAWNQLVNAVGADEAKKLVDQAAHKVRTSFSR